MVKELAKGVMGEYVNKLESIRDYTSHVSSRAAEIVEKAKRELEVVQEAIQVGVSKTFLGSSLMLVGITDGNLPPGSGGDIDIRFGRGYEMRLHGDPEAIKKIEGKYKAILLLYKI